MFLKDKGAALFCKQRSWLNWLVNLYILSRFFVFKTGYIQFLEDCLILGTKPMLIKASTLPMAHFYHVSSYFFKININRNTSYIVEIRMKVYPLSCYYL